MDFDEVQPYAQGDDVRFIDWNVSARTGDLHIKHFVEERELTVFIVVDASRSLLFGTAESRKKDIAAELAAVLAFSAIKNNDRVGLVTFDSEIGLHIPPKKGKKHVLRVITDVLKMFEGHIEIGDDRSSTPDDTGARVGGDADGVATNLGAALEFVTRISRRKAIVFVISDFIASGYEAGLKIAARRHDVVPLIIEDPMERELPAINTVLTVRSLESGEIEHIDLGSRAHRDAYKSAVDARRAARNRQFTKLKVDHVEINADEPWIERLAAFFKRRAGRP